MDSTKYAAQPATEELLRSLSVWWRSTVRVTGAAACLASCQVARYRSTMEPGTWGHRHPVMHAAAMTALVLAVFVVIPALLFGTGGDRCY